MDKASMPLPIYNITDGYHCGSFSINYIPFSLKVIIFYFSLFVVSLKSRKISRVLKTSLAHPPGAVIP